MSRSDGVKEVEPEPESVPLTKRHPPIRWLVRRLHSNLDALREIVREVLPHIQTIDDKRLGADGMAAVDSLSQGRRAELSAYIAAQLRAAERHRPPDDDVEDEETADQEPAQSDADERSSKTSRMEFDLEGEVLNEIFEGDRHHLGNFLHGLEKLGGPSRTLIMRNSLLTQAVGGFEVFIAGLATRYYVEHPSALDQSEGTFTLADIRTFVDVDDAADELIARRVSALMRGSLDDWAVWFKKHCNADFEALAMDWEAVREVFQRRHIMMHNGGLISRQYLAHVKSEGTPPGIGQRLPVTVEYLEDALDQLDVLGTAIGVMAWGTWYPSHRNASSAALLQRTFDLMLDERWGAVDVLAKRAKPLKCDAAIAEPIRCNGWHSRSVVYGPGSVRNEVSKWDTSALAGRFRLVQAVLLEDFERALDMVPKLVQAEEVTPGELHHWPILEGLRQHDGYALVYAGLVKSETTTADKGDHGPLVDDRDEEAPPSVDPPPEPQ